MSIDIICGKFLLGIFPSTKIEPNPIPGHLHFCSPPPSFLFFYLNCLVFVPPTFFFSVTYPLYSILSFLVQLSVVDMTFSC